MKRIVGQLPVALLTLATEAMTLNGTTALLLLLSGAESSPSNSTGPTLQVISNAFFIEIIRCVHGKYNFKNFVFFISEHLNLHNHGAKRFFERLGKSFPIVAITIIHRAQGVYPMAEFLTTPTLCFVLTSGPDDGIMSQAAYSLRSVRKLKTIFVVFPVLETSNIYDRREVFDEFWAIICSIYQWIWKRQFLNTVLVTIRNHVYLHNPYPTPEIINKTDDWTVDDFFVDRSKDMRGYVVDTPIRYDMPRTFFTRSPSRGHQREVSGATGKLFTTFLAYHNVTLVDTSPVHSETEPLVIGRVFELMRNKSIEVSIQSFSATDSWGLSQSYPIAINDWCIMVPYRTRTNDQLYLKYLLHQSTWIFLCVSLAYISTIIWLLAPKSKREFSAALLQALCSILCIVPTAILRTPSARMRCLYITLFVFGFFTSNMYVTKMASFLTASLPMDQIDTVADLISARLRVKVLASEYRLIEEWYAEPFLEQLDIVDREFMHHHRDSLNTSYGYSITSDRWNFINFQQSDLRKPLFRLSKICMGPYYHVFPMHLDSHFRDPFKNFTLFASQSGLLEYWQKAAFGDALLLKIMRMITVCERPISLSMGFLHTIWIIWWLGLTLAGIVFLMEMKWRMLTGL